MTTLIKDWDDLRNIPNESATHILEVDDYNGWLKAKCCELDDPSIMERNAEKDWWDRLDRKSVV